MNFWRYKPKHKCWIIAKTAGKTGIQVAYFQWSPYKGWDWTRDIRKAQLFYSQHQAEQSIRSTSAEWQAIWEPVKLST